MRTRALATAALLAVMTAGPRAAQDSRELLDWVKGRTGLCILLGAGSREHPGLIADLATSSGLLVHGLATDEPAFERAKAAIEARGLAGRATVERAPLSPLPYLNDLARFVVVDDAAALAGHGVTREEFLRITSPGGTLCVREGVAWRKVAKPMPAGMDEWTHPWHGPDANQVSTDSVLRMPVGLRWQDGLPVVASFRAGTGAWVAAGGRVFTLGTNELENLIEGPLPGDQYYTAYYPEYLTARDAFSGIPLWKLKLDSIDPGGAGNWLNSLPLVATDRRVWAGGKSSIVVADAETGKVVGDLKTLYAPSRLLLLDGVVVAASWQKRARRDNVWTWVPRAGDAVAAGSVQAFAADTGTPLWEVNVAAFKMAASQGVLYLEVLGGATPESSGIAAFDLKTGKERWRLSREKLQCAGELSLGIAGPDFVTISKAKEDCVAVLDAGDGRERFAVPGATNWVPMVRGELWLNGKRVNPTTGAANGPAPIHARSSGCQQTNLSDQAVLAHWGVGELTPSAAKGVSSRAVRPACVMSFVPAYGMAYTAANPCACMPGAAYGFTALGPSEAPPAAAEFERPRPTEKGPAFGAVAEADAQTDGWPTFRHDSERGAATSSRLGEGLKLAWSRSAAKSSDDLLSKTWRSMAMPLISAPVVEGGSVFVTANDIGEVVALESATGKALWTATLGSRLSGPPTLYRGLCVVGCHDGWVYALRAKDGRLEWRTRVAPRERRMTAFGRVESVWPALGPVLAHQNVLYATAGRSSEIEGGIALVALDPSTGQSLWGTCISPGPQRTNDILATREQKLAWHYLSLDPKTGALLTPHRFEPVTPLQGGMLDAAWTAIPHHRRAGNAYLQGDLYSSELAWNETFLVSPRGGLPREKAGADGKRRSFEDKAWLYSWESGIASPRRVYAIALAGNAALYAGTSDAKNGTAAGFLRIVSPEGGELLSEFPLACPPVCDGLAVARGCVYVSLANGDVCCFAK